MPLCVAAGTIVGELVATLHALTLRLRPTFGPTAEGCHKAMNHFTGCGVSINVMDYRAWRGLDRARHDLGRYCDTLRATVADPALEIQTGGRIFSLYVPS